MKIWRDLFLFTAMCIISCYSVSELYKIHTENREKKISHFTRISEPFAKAMTLEFSGLTSDYLMLKTLTYMGERIMKKEGHTPEEWQMIHQALVQITNLDVRFLDPYIVAQMSLPWDAGMVEETNILLEKAAKVLTEDYRPYFFLWYNYFYFLNNPETAGHYLQKAAKMKGAPTYFSTLAARMNLYTGKIYAAVIFLKETIRETNDPALQKSLKRRLQALQKIGFLEQKIQVYKKRFHTSPKQLQELVDKDIITKIPADPYGGNFYIMESGRVYTTSKLVLPKTEKK